MLLCYFKNLFTYIIYTNVKTIYKFINTFVYTIFKFIINIIVEIIFNFIINILVNLYTYMPKHTHACIHKYIVLTHSYVFACIVAVDCWMFSISALHSREQSGTVHCWNVHCHLPQYPLTDIWVLDVWLKIPQVAPTEVL